MATTTQYSETIEAASSESAHLVVDRNNEQWFTGLKMEELLKYSSLEVILSRNGFEYARPKLSGHRITLRNNFHTITCDFSRLDIYGCGAKELDAVTLVRASLGKANKLVLIYAGVTDDEYKECILLKAINKVTEGFGVEPVLQQQESEQGNRIWVWEGAAGAALHWTGH